jgi:lipopolysaccharide/colanic/teichoic acid biosynthesis glycosyltransferase
VAQTGAQYDISKRAFDIVLSLCALLALAPLLLSIAALVAVTSPGRILFRQERAGKDGVPFTLYKFRTMRSADCDDSGVAQTQLCDPRVTGLGSFLRRTSLDELPQLINILKGDMSFVGPRPHVAGQLAAGRPYRDAVPYYEQRLEMRPGLTGWAQVNGYRGPTTDIVAARERVLHDLAYIQNASLSLDIRIIVLTAIREFVVGSGN